MQFAGALAYSNAGNGTGDLDVARDLIGIRSVTGFLDVPGLSGGTARVSVDVQRAWILPLWTGQVVVRDRGAGVSVTTPVIGSITRATIDTSATTTSSWFTFGTFPNLFRPYSLKWTVTDAG